MPIRWIPARDDADFPYDAAKRVLESLDGIEFLDKDFSAVIEAGVRIGWPQDVIDEHWAMAARGKCYDFYQESEPGLRGTLFEDNVFFVFTGRGHEDACLSLIERGAAQLGLRVYRQ